MSVVGYKLRTRGVLTVVVKCGKCGRSLAELYGDGTAVNNMWMPRGEKRPGQEWPSGSATFECHSRCGRVLRVNDEQITVRYAAAAKPDGIGSFLL